MPAWTAPKNNYIAGDVLSYAELNKYANDLVCLTEGGSYAFARASSDSTTTSTSYVDISGASVTVTKLGYWLVGICVNTHTNNSAGEGRYTINYSGSDDANEIRFYGNTYGSVTNYYLLNNTSTLTIKLRYRTVTGSDTVYYYAKATTLFARWVGP